MAQAKAEILFTGEEIAQRHLDVATNYKTIYGYAMYGWQITDYTIKIKSDQNLNGWYTRAHINGLKAVANQKPPVWGFDCVNLTKGILWGWTGDESSLYGGAKARSHGVPDTNANGMIQQCYDVTTDFTTIEVGEGLWMDGHWGLYVGNGRAVECTGRWDNCVQITAVHNIGKISGLNGRFWTKHGKLPWVKYSGVADTIEPEVIELGSRVIRKGTQGTDVKELQEDLMRLGYSLPQYGADGECGKETVNAIKIFQEDHNLEVDGEFGKESYKALQKALQNQGQTAPADPAKPKYTVTIKHLDKAEADEIKARWPEAEVAKE